MSQKNDHHHSPAGYISAIIVHGLLIYIAGHLPNWFHFISSSWSAVVWLFYISFAANIVANVLYLIYDEKPFRSAIQFILNVIGLIAIYSLYIIFPFSVSDSWTSIIRIFLILAIFGTVIGCVVEFMQIFFPKKEHV